MSIVTATPDAQALVAKSESLAVQLAGLSIARLADATPAALTGSLEGSAIIGRLADDFLREVDAMCDPVREAAHKAWKAAVKQQADLRAPAELLKKQAGQLGWACNAELKRRQEEADRLAQQERDRLQREADEAARIEREAAQRAQDDALLAEAARLEQAGDTEAATRLVENPPEVWLARPAPIFVPPTPQIHVKVEGAPTFGADWDFVVENEALVPREYLMLDEVTIRRVVKAMKISTRIPGIKAIEKPRTTFRRG